MREDSSIYNGISQILLNVAPIEAKKVIMKAKFLSNDQRCHYEYDYINDLNERNWFTTSRYVNLGILNYLIKLRQFHIDNNLTNGKTIWTGCELMIDLDKNRVNINFMYD